MQNDGTQSWIVISRDVPEENKKPIHFEKVASSAGELVARKQQEQFIPSPSSSLSTIMPINQRKCKYFSAVANTTSRLQHQGYLREDDEAILNGESCYLCFIANTLTHRNGRSNCGQTICLEEVTREDFIIAWTLTATFSSCVLSKGPPEGTE